MTAAPRLQSLRTQSTTRRWCSSQRPQVPRHGPPAALPQHPGRAHRPPAMEARGATRPAHNLQAVVNPVIATGLFPRRIYTAAAGGARQRQRCPRTCSAAGCCLKMTAPPPPPPPPPVQEAGALNASVERILAAWVSSHNPPWPTSPPGAATGRGSADW